MNTGIIASRYADALLKYVNETGEGETVYRQAGILNEKLHTVPELSRFLESQTLLQLSGKMNLLEKSLGDETMCTSLSRFLKLVMIHDRIQYLRYILHYYRMRWRKSQGVSPATLVVSAPSPELEDRIKAMFSDFTGYKLDLKTVVNPSLIGGFIFEVADRRVDASVARQLADLRRQFEEKNERVV
mgnify:CR=1 FL=1